MIIYFQYYIKLSNYNKNYFYFLFFVKYFLKFILDSINVILLLYILEIPIIYKFMVILIQYLLKN
jgi:hypothetical protein